MASCIKHRYWWIAGVTGIILLVAVGLWLRMGAIEVRVDEAALQALAPAADPTEFTILTYNVHGRPWFDETRERFRLLSPLLNRFDICAFQECFKDHYRLWEAARHPVKIYHATRKHPFKITGSGLSILGNFPLKEAKGFHFKDEGDFQNRPASKGVLLARFDAHGMPLDVYTTHIAAGKKADSRRAKLAQANEIVQFVRENSPAAHTVILLGDFNMRPSRGPEDKEENKDNPKVVGFDRIVSSLGLRDASDEINGPIGIEIDRILFRPGEGYTMRPLRWQRDDPAFYAPDGRPLSDHEPVFATFQWSRL